MHTVGHTQALVTLQKYIAEEEKNKVPIVCTWMKV